MNVNNRPNLQPTGEISDNRGAASPKPASNPTDQKIQDLKAKLGELNDKLGKLEQIETHLSDQQNIDQIGPERLAAAKQRIAEGKPKIKGEIAQVTQQIKQLQVVQELTTKRASADKKAESQPNPLTDKSWIEAKNTPKASPSESKSWVPKDAGGSAKPLPQAPKQPGKPLPAIPQKSTNLLDQMNGQINANRNGENHLSDPLKQRPPRPTRPLPATPKPSSDGAKALNKMDEEVTAKQDLPPSASSDTSAKAGGLKRKAGEFLEKLVTKKRKIESNISAKVRRNRIQETKIDGGDKNQELQNKANSLGLKLDSFNRQFKYIQTGKETILDNKQSRLESKNQTLNKLIKNNPNPSENTKTMINDLKKEIGDLKTEIKEIKAFFSKKMVATINSETGLPEFKPPPAQEATTDEVSASLMKLSSQIDAFAKEGITNLVKDPNTPSTNIALASVLRSFSETDLGAKALNSSPDTKQAVERAVNRQDIIILKDSSQNIHEALEIMTPALNQIMGFVTVNEVAPVITTEGNSIKGGEPASDMMKRVDQGMKAHHEYGVKLETTPHEIGKTALANTQKEERNQELTKIASEKNDMNDLLNGLAKIAGKKLGEGHPRSQEFKKLQEDLKAAIERNGGSNLVDISARGYVTEIAPIVQQMSDLIGQIETSNLGPPPPPPNS